jgi:hypothetical protein
MPLRINPCIEVPRRLLVTAESNKKQHALTADDM